MTNSLDTNKCIDQCLSLFISILISNPKVLFDIKKYAIRTLDIMVRDMPIYSSRFLGELIEPAWRVIVLQMTLYTEQVIFNKRLEYSETEQRQIHEENYDYKRGYESEDEDEVFGIEGLTNELIDFAVDLLKRSGVMEALQDNMLTFLLCLKNYCLMPHQSMLLWASDANLYITEEYDDENINSIRNKSVSLIKDIVKDIEDEVILKFLNIILQEFFNGIDPENYLEVIKLDDYNFLFPYFEKMNSDQVYITRRHEANLLILGNLAEDILILRDKNKLSDEDLLQLIKFLFSIISNPSEGRGFNFRE